MQEVDFYGELGIGKGASDADIKKAYRAQARKWHPDVNQEDGAKEKFQTINEAYQVLSDPQMRQRYDQFGVAGVRSGGAGGAGPGMQDFDLGDIFESFFGGQGGPAGGGRRRAGPTQGDDLRFDLQVDFQTALFGGSKKIRITHLETCGVCTGSGVAPGSSVNTCATCGGRGVVLQTMNTILGRMQQQARCPTCGGTGTVVEKYCGSCDGQGTNKKSKQLTITIPPGVEDGNRLRVRGEGDAGPKGGPAGDLYVFLAVTPDTRFRREGMDIYSDVSMSYVDVRNGRVASNAPPRPPPPPVPCFERATTLLSAAIRRTCLVCGACPLTGRVQRYFCLHCRGISVCIDGQVGSVSLHRPSWVPP